MKMEKDHCERRKLIPERVIEDLRHEGTTVTYEEAETILKFVQTIARIAVNQYLSGRLEDL
ncbi:hypothetical protein OOZ15_12320 [Galbibacter sp. EGI 63066]|uniref:hypothetical protein n=1 Tax=Galbibacter sp. EGI 63066 TaxID=2993559 RepID=UPI0022499312|nr:hypothetical protein [Galbibacter sp. EGI 63066]MCX2680729.1 hypothetical protein [Galbibacter sp. EGI 63066]